MKNLFIILILLVASSAYGQNVGIGIATPQSKLHVKPNTSAAVQIDPYGSAINETGDLRFLEIPGNGVDFVGFKAPDAIPASQIWVLPPTDGTSTQVLTTDGTGKLYWQSIPGPGSVTTISGHCYTCDGF